MRSTLVRGLTLGLAAVYAALGILEVVLKVAEAADTATIAFFGGSLLGGAGLIACGLVRQPSTARRTLIMLGAAAGLLATAWTILVPALAIAVIVGQALSSTPASAGPSSP